MTLRLWSTKDVEAKVGLVAYPLQRSPSKGDDRQITGWSRVTTAANKAHEYTLGDGEVKASGLGPGIDQVDCTAELGRRVGQEEDVIRKHEKLQSCLDDSRVPRHRDAFKFVVTVEVKDQVDEKQNTQQWRDLATLEQTLALGEVPPIQG